MINFSGICSRRSPDVKAGLCQQISVPLWVTSVSSVCFLVN